MQPSPIDAGGGRPADGDGRGLREDSVVARFALTQRQDLRVGDALGIEFSGKDHGSGEHRSGQRAAAGLVDAGDAREALLTQAPLVSQQILRPQSHPNRAGGQTTATALPTTRSRGT
jgi:hypothetical protein